MTEPRVVFDASNVFEIQERSDFDRHASKKEITKQLLAEGEDWGDGFVVQDEMVVVTRSKVDGRILRTTPVSEALFMQQPRDEYEPVEGPTRTTPDALGISEREKLVDILAWRLFKWYRDQPKDLKAYNPVHDGIPTAPPGSPENLQPIPGTKLYQASPGEVFEWLKTQVIGPRAQLVNKKQGRTGYAQDYALRLSRDPS